MSMVAVNDKPPESVTLTRKPLVPALALAGVPESVPLLATVSQPGPLTFEKANVSPGLGSVAEGISEAEYDCPALTAGSASGLLVNEGAPFTLIYMVAVFDSPTESVALTRKVLVPRSE